MLWGMKLYPLQRSRKRRFAPGADAKEMNLILFSLEDKHCSVYKPASATVEESRSMEGIGSWRKKENWKAKDKGKIHLPHQSLSMIQEQATEKLNLYCSPILHKMFSGFCSSSYFAAASFTHLILAGSFAVQKRPAPASLKTKGAAFDWYSILSS